MGVKSFEMYHGRKEMYHQGYFSAWISPQKERDVRKEDPKIRKIPATPVYWHCG